jgi:hypothetical protein
LYTTEAVEKNEMYQAAYPKPPAMPNLAPSTDAFCTDLAKIQEIMVEEESTRKDLLVLEDESMSPRKNVAEVVATGEKAHRMKK